MKSTTNQRKEHVGYNSLAIFIRLAVVVMLLLPRKSATSREILRKFELIAVQGHPRSFIDLGVNRKRIMQLAMINSNYGRMMYLLVFDILPHLHVARK